MSPGEPTGGAAGAWQPRESAGLDAFVAFLLYFGVIGVAVQLLSGPDGPGEGAERLHLQVLAGVIGAVCVIGMAVVRPPAPWRLLPWAAVRSYLLFLLWWAPVAFVLYPWLLHAFGYEMPAQQMVSYLARADRDDWMFWFVVLYTCLGAPIVEEILFRGYLYRPLEVWAGPVLAVGVSALVFAAFHEPFVALPIALFGLQLGYLRSRSGGIGCPVLVHSLHNTWTVAVVLLFPEITTVVFDKS